LIATTLGEIFQKLERHLELTLAPIGVDFVQKHTISRIAMVVVTVKYNEFCEQESILLGY